MSATESTDPNSTAVANSFYAKLSSWLLRIDRPEHTRVRKLANQAFDRTFTNRMQAAIAADAHRLLDCLDTRGRIDVIADFAGPLVLSAVAGQLGVPPEHQLLFRAWSVDVGTAAEASPDISNLSRADRSLRLAEEYLTHQLRQRRGLRQDDLLTRWLAAENEGRRLTESEIVGLGMLWVLAGQETATHLVANGVLALLQNRDQWETLTAEPALAQNAAAELLRYNTPLQGVLRVAKTRLQLGDKGIDPGLKIVLWLAAANRDPEVFAHPDRLDIRRADCRQVGFGHGAHYCLGANLAVLILATALGVLVERAPRLRLASDLVQWQGNYLFRCQRSLPVFLE